MKTSFFFSNKLTKEMNLVNVAGLSPKEFRKKFPDMKHYDDLKPAKELVQDYKSGKINKKEYTRVYKEQLSKLEPFKVYNNLKNSVILCWERPEDFCHRHLISDWIYINIGIKVEEL